MIKRNRGAQRRAVSSGGKKKSVSIIGAGRLGTALAIALRKSGHAVELLVARRPATVRRALRLVGGKAMGLSVNDLRRLTPNQRERFERTSLFIISTPDDAIASAAAQLARAMKPHTLKRGARVVLHTSGALSSKVLQPLKDLGFSVGSLHPLVSISDSKTGAEWLAKAYFSVEGDPAAVRAGKRLVSEIGGRTFPIDADTKALYHAAALMASPNMTALFDVALEMLNRCGLGRANARKVLLPLVESTLHNLSVQDPSRALTGTFKRGDLATVRKHLAAIDSQNCPKPWRPISCWAVTHSSWPLAQESRQPK